MIYGGFGHIYKLYIWNYLEGGRQSLSLSNIWSENSRPKSEAKGDENWRSYKTPILILCAVWSSQLSQKNIYTIQMNKSNIEIFNFVVFQSMNALSGTRIIELPAFRPRRELRLTS